MQLEINGVAEHSLYHNFQLFIRKMQKFIALSPSDQSLFAVPIIIPAAGASAKINARLFKKLHDSSTEAVVFI